MTCSSQWHVPSTKHKQDTGFTNYGVHLLAWSYRKIFGGDSSVKYSMKVLASWIKSLTNTFSKTKTSKIIPDYDNLNCTLGNTHWQILVQTSNTVLATIQILFGYHCIFSTKKERKMVHQWTELKLELPTCQHPHVNTTLPDWHGKWKEKHAEISHPLEREAELEIMHLSMLSR